MQEGAKPKTGAEFEAAVAQVAKVHVRAYQEAGVAGSCVESWDLEFLRGGEFQTFTSLARIWELVKEANKQIGTPYFKVMVDAAHCGDSVLTIEENQALIAQIAKADEMGMFHCSAKTTDRQTKARICRSFPSRRPSLRRSKKSRRRARFRHHRWPHLQRNGSRRHGRHHAPT